jgi:hypothetical protein
MSAAKGVGFPHSRAGSEQLPPPLMPMPPSALTVAHGGHGRVFIPGESMSLAP